MSTTLRKRSPETDAVLKRRAHADVSHLRGFLKVKRGTTSLSYYPGFGVGFRWSSRFFELTPDYLIQSKCDPLTALATEDVDLHRLRLLDVKLARLATPSDVKAPSGFGGLISKLLGSAGHAASQVLATVSAASATTTAATTTTSSGSTNNGGHNSLTPPSSGSGSARTSLHPTAAGAALVQDDHYAYDEELPPHSHPTTSGTSNRFVVELVGDASDGVDYFLFEAESSAQARVWVEAIQSKIRSGPGTPVVLVKEETGRPISDVYHLDNVTLGSGMSGTVKRITRKSDGKIFAMKTITLTHLTPKQLSALRNEIDIVKALDHPHICKLYETYTEPGKCVRLVLELCPGGELFDRLHARKRFDEKWVAKLAFRMVGVLRFLHENNIAHRDLKLENWLFRSSEDDDEIVLIDFGLSHKYRPNEHMHKRVGTSYYVAPEVLKGDYVGVQADVWSFGVIIYMLLLGTAPFDGQDDDAILDRIACGRPPNYESSAWKRVSDTGKDFVQRLLTFDPEQRLTAEAALLHPWLLAQEKLVTAPDVDDDMYRRLARFAGFSALKRVAIEIVAYSLDHKDVKELSDVFEGLDSDHNGYVTFRGLARGLTKTHPGIAPEELRRIFDALDEDHSGKIHVSEFIAATMQEKYHLDEQHLRLAFEAMDRHNTGFVTVADLRSLLGSHVTPQRALEMIKAAELDNHGDEHKLSFAEFLTFVREDGETRCTAIRKSGIEPLRSTREVSSN